MRIKKNMTLSVCKHKILSFDAARSLPLAGPQKHLNRQGDNIGNVVQFMERDHPDEFKKILDEIAHKIPGIDKISTERMHFEFLMEDQSSMKAMEIIKNKL